MSNTNENKITSIDAAINQSLRDEPTPLEKSVLDLLNNGGNPKDFLKDLSELFFAYNSSDYADCTKDRQDKSHKFLLLGEFFTQLDFILKPKG